MIPITPADRWALILGTLWTILGGVLFEAVMGKRSVNHPPLTKRGVAMVLIGGPAIWIYYLVLSVGLLYLKLVHGTVNRLADWVSDK